MRVRPQVGQATMLTPVLRRPAALRISFAVKTSCTGSAVSDTRIVSPMPWHKSAPMPMADLMVPMRSVPVSVTPTCRG